MSKPNHEPESYDLDAMMNRLKSRSSESSDDDGELVTRADGTKAIKVRRKKRRTDQPIKGKPRRVRMFQVTAVLVVIFLAVLAIGFVAVYVNSSPFQKGVVKKASWTTGGEVKLNQFRMNPTGANAIGVDVTWPKGNVLELLSMRMLRADVTPLSFLGGDLTGQGMEAKSGKLVLRIPEAGMPWSVLPEVSGELPIRYDQYGVKEFALQMRVDDRVAARLDHSEAAFMSAKRGNHAQLILARGELNMHGWPKLRLDRAHVEFSEGQAEVVGMRLKHVSDTKGVVQLSGVLSPYESQDHSRIEVDAESFLMSGIVGVDLGDLFVGRIDTATDAEKSYLTIAFGEDPSVELDLSFSGSLSKPFQMKNFPFLYGFSQTLEDEWFAQPTFEDLARGRIRRTSDRVEICQLDFSSKGRMALKGTVVMDRGQKLSGHVDVGVAHAMISTAENQVLEKMFGPPQEGYRWVRLELSGSAKSPQDNFSELYEQVLDDLRQVPEVKPASVAPSFEDLTRPE